MGAVNADFPTHVVSLLDLAFRQVRRELENTVGSPVDLRPSQVRLLSLTPADGMRVTDLAARVGMTKQAVGEFVAELQQSGHLEVVHDPTDGRVRVVRPTAAGRAVASRAEAAIAELESRWRAAVGPRRWATFRAVLAEIGSARPTSRVPVP
jgi:DNA-binding MarR family transcriptional regulator